MNKIINKLACSLMGLILLVNPFQTTHGKSLEEQTVLAALALNIVRFTTWPDEVQGQMNDTIDFCVLGDNVVQQSFADIDGKAVGNKTLRVINLSHLSNFEQCHGLYISEMKQNILLQVFVEIKKKPILTIGDSLDFAELGGMVELKNINNKMSLYVNLAMLKESHFNMSSRLLSLAKIIDKSLL